MAVASIAINSMINNDMTEMNLSVMLLFFHMIGTPIVIS